MQFLPVNCPISVFVKEQHSTSPVNCTFGETVLVQPLMTDDRVKSERWMNGPCKIFVLSRHTLKISGRLDSVLYRLFGHTTFWLLTYAAAYDNTITVHLYYWPRSPTWSCSKWFFHPLNICTWRQWDDCALWKRIIEDEQEWRAWAVTRVPIHCVLSWKQQVPLFILLHLNCCARLFNWRPPILCYCCCCLSNHPHLAGDSFVVCWSVTVKIVVTICAYRPTCNPTCTFLATCWYLSTLQFLVYSSSYSSGLSTECEIFWRIRAHDNNIQMSVPGPRPTANGPFHGCHGAILGHILFLCRKETHSCGIKWNDG